MNPFASYITGGLKMRQALFILTLCGCEPSLGQSLIDTKAIEWPEADLSQRMMDSAHRFIEQKIKDSIGVRDTAWTRGQVERADWIEAKRSRICKMLGVVERRSKPKIEWFGDQKNPAVVFDCDKFIVYQARWPTVKNLSATGLYVKQKKDSVGNVVLVPDGTQSPEQLMGMINEPTQEDVGLKLANRGFDLLIPAIVSRKEWVNDDPRVKRSMQTRREWIYRQAFHMGRHIIGIEVHSILGAVDAFKQMDSEKKIGVLGYGEGGMLSMFAAAIDPRIDSTWVSGYFGDRQQVWQEPISRNLFGRLNEFGDAELAALVYPRALVIEHSSQPVFKNGKGEVKTGDIHSTTVEFQRIQQILKSSKPTRDTSRWKIQFTSNTKGSGHEVLPAFSEKSMSHFCSAFGKLNAKRGSLKTVSDRRKRFSLEAREQELIERMETYVQDLVRGSAHVRDDRFLYSIMPELKNRRWSTDKKLPTLDTKSFVEKAKKFKTEFYDEWIGRFRDKLLPPNARTRKLKETDKWIAYDVVLDVYDDFFAWGVILVPKGIKKGEKRPVVVCQHGRNGLPRDTIDGNKTAYNNFAAKLADEGFVTFSPHNLYRGEDRYRWLDRKANSVGKSLFSFIVAQHDQITRWLASQSFVDGERIAFYGLSYGGETAVRVPTLLKRYCLSICSGDFNQWTRKVAATDQPFSFMGTIEWEMPYWNLGHTFDYAEMAYLMIPRPFMVERGHLDLVGRDQWVAHEYAKVRWLYAQLGLADRTEIEFFQGGHSINGDRAFQFLRKHLDWNHKPKESR